MTNYNKRQDWRVNLYRGENIFESWLIENRTENEAEKEAIADINNGGYCPDDWTMTVAENKS